MQMEAINLDALGDESDMDAGKLMGQIRRELAGMSEGDRQEIMEIMDDLFTEEEMGAMLADDPEAAFSMMGGL